MSDLLDDPPIHLTPMSSDDRDRLRYLRALPAESLTPDDKLELRRLHHRSEDERWEASPDYGPGGSTFVVQPLRPGKGRPRGVSGETFREVVKALRAGTGSRPPTQAWVGYQLGFGEDEHDEEGARRVRKILRRTGWPSWRLFARVWYRGRAARAAAETRTAPADQGYPAAGTGRAYNASDWPDREDWIRKVFGDE